MIGPQKYTKIRNQLLQMRTPYILLFMFSSFLGTECLKNKNKNDHQKSWNILKVSENYQLFRMAFLPFAQILEWEQNMNFDYIFKIDLNYNRIICRTCSIYVIYVLYIVYYTYVFSWPWIQITMLHSVKDRMVNARPCYNQLYKHYVHTLSWEWDILPPWYMSSPNIPYS